MPDQPKPNRPTNRPSDAETDDLGYRDNEEEKAYERAHSDAQPEVSSEPEPDTEPADAG